MGSGKSRDTAVPGSPSWDLASVARAAGLGEEGALLVCRAAAFRFSVAPSRGGIRHLGRLHHVLDVILKSQKGKTLLCRGSRSEQLQRYALPL